MPRLRISSDQLPEDLDDAGRLRRWMEISERFYGSIDRSHASDQPFFAHIDLMRLGPMMLTTHQSTLTRAARSVRNVAADGNDGFLIGLYNGHGALAHRQMGREAGGMGSLFSVLSFGEPGELLIEPGASWTHLNIPGGPIRELVAKPDDLVARSFDATTPAARYLRRYLDFLHAPDTLADADAALEEHVATNLIDLVALCLGAGRDAADLARMRGLRAVRLQILLGEIKAGFADPAFSVQTVARKTGLSVRYVQDLLHESGASFTERVQELRLQQARRMLAHPRFDHLSISQIAYGCGFNEVSHFNRAFRRRFGAPPGDIRARSNGGAPS
jgi:AraC-like DNA-binding protein